jgi:hypothetical protein
MRRARVTPLAARVIGGVLVATLLAGCATRTQTGAAVGAGVGAAAGAAIGATQGTTGALIGAGVGALLGGIVGALVGRYQDQRVGDRAAAARATADQPADASMIRIQKGEVVPATARAGEPIVVRVQYAVLAPGADTRIALNEWRMLRTGDRDIAAPQHRQMSVEQGVFVSTYRFAVPADTPPGQYRIVTLIETDGVNPPQRARTEAILVVK